MAIKCKNVCKRQTLGQTEMVLIIWTAGFATHNAAVLLAAVEADKQFLKRNRAVLVVPSTHVHKYKTLIYKH